MPKERIHKRGQGFADLLVIWEKNPAGPFDQNVRLFMAAANEAPGPTGHFYFHPDDGTDPVGPVDVELDRPQINYLIQVLRKARAEVYGKDE